MSNAAKLADILKRLGDAHYQAADELIGLANEQPGAGAVPPVASAPADDLPDFPPMEDMADRSEPQGSLAMCPRHRKPYNPEGKWGPYCTEKVPEPPGEWVNERGYCRITPKNVDKWLRSRAA